MARYRIQNRAVAIKEETTEGVHATPTLAANALRLENARWDFESETEEVDEHQDGIDAGDPIPIQGPVNLGFGVRLRGVATPGTSVPEWDAVMQAMGFARTDLAAAEAGTAQAGAATSITLRATASAVNDAFVGMPIKLTGGTGSGQWNVISAYNGTPKVATVLHAWATNPDITTTYDIPANSVYRPASQGLKTFSIRSYDKARTTATNSRLIQASGAVADGQLVLPTRGIARLASVRFRGLLEAAPSNVADPGAATFPAGTIQPVPFRGATVRLGSAAVAFAAVQFNIGAGAELEDDPAAAFGYGPAGIVRRQITFTVDPLLDLLSTYNAIQDWIDAAKRAFSAMWNLAGTAGKRMAVAAPSLLITRGSDGDSRGTTTTPIEGRATGDDTGLYLCVF